MNAEGLRRASRAGLHRQFLFGGLRIGLYDPVKRLFMGEKATGEAPLYLKIAAGLTTGALAIMVANPTDLVKVLHPTRHTCAKSMPRLPSMGCLATRPKHFAKLWKSTRACKSLLRCSRHRAQICRKPSNGCIP